MELNNVKSRLLSKIVIDLATGCWNWVGGKGNNGYGRIRINDKFYLPHRASYVIFVGDIPEGMCVCHKCDNPSCINPEHLFVGTRNDNMQDALRKGRLKIPKSISTQFEIGHKPKNRSLSNNQVLEIKRMLKDGFTIHDISSTLNIGRHTINNIKRGHSYFNIKIDS